MPTTVTVEFSQFRKIIRKHPKILEEALADTGEQWMQKADELIRHTGHVFTHQLRNDLEYSIERLRNAITLIAFMPATNHHGVVIHENRKRGSAWPPVAPIAEWVEKKLGIPSSDKKFDGIVFNIRRSIGRNGMSSLPAGGLKFYWNPLKKFNLIWLEQIAEDTTRALQRL